MAEQADRLIVELEVLTVGPKDRLLIKLPEESPDELIEDLSETLRKMGLAKRSLILAGEVEFVLIEGE